MSIVRFATLCDKCGKRSEEYKSWYICIYCGCHVCGECSVDQRDDEGLFASATCKECRAKLDEEEPPCECVQVDADEWSARYCPAHGPGSPAEKRWKKIEADDEAESARRIGILLGFDKDTV